MINGAQVIIYSKDAEGDRTFFKDVPGFHQVDAGHVWLICALQPPEVACYPRDENDHHVSRQKPDRKGGPVSSHFPPSNADL